MTPRLAVTIDQAGDIIDGYHVLGKEAVTMRLPERPTMPCAKVGREVRKPDCPDCHGTGYVPIPEGARVRVEYPCDVCDGSGRGSLDGRPQDWLMCGECNGKGWHPVALATLTEVHAALADGQPYRWYVTLSDIKPVEADQ